MAIDMQECPAVTDAEPTASEPRDLPKRRSGAPAPGEKRRKYLRYKRIATIAVLVLVTAVVVLLTGFLTGKSEDKDVVATRALLNDLGKAIEAHHTRVGALPEKIAELVNPSSPYRGDPIPEDAWRELIEYRAIDPAKGDYRLRSAGPDKKLGTEDDLVWPQGTSWE